MDYILGSEHELKCDGLGMTRSEAYQRMQPSCQRCGQYCGRLSDNRRLTHDDVQAKKGQSAALRCILLPIAIATPNAMNATNQHHFVPGSARFFPYSVVRPLTWCFVMK
jgi:hypothetical protein